MKNVQHFQSFEPSQDETRDNGVQRVREEIDKHTQNNTEQAPKPEQLTIQDAQDRCRGWDVNDPRAQESIEESPR